MKITDPRGQTWRVTRRWVPWRRRLKGWGDAAPSGPGLGDDPISLVIGVLFLLVLLPFLLVAFVALLELLLLLLVLPFAVLARVALGGHWVIEAREGFQPVWEAEAGSWADSRRAIEARAADLAAGRRLPEEGRFAKRRGT